MTTYHVGLIGLGTVGYGVYETIRTHQKRLQNLLGRRVRVSSIVIEQPDKHTKMKEKCEVSTAIESIVENDDIDVVFEAIVGIEPAFSYVKQCIKAGKHVITANKEMFATHGKELKTLAKAHNVQIGFEATTAGGVPIIQTIQQLLQVNKVIKLQAILNGTSNYILTEMRKNNLSFPVALKQAQELGYAEADPKNDVEGYDAHYKLMILTELIYGKQPNWEDVERIGIHHLSTSDINNLQNERMKHIAIVSQKDGVLCASVKPVTISESHPLYSVEGVNNGIHLETDIVGPLTLTGPGAGALPTASAMIEDFCTILETDAKENVKKPILA